MVVDEIAYQKLDGLIQTVLNAIWEFSEENEAGFAWGVIAFNKRFNDAAFDHHTDNERELT